MSNDQGSYTELAEDWADSGYFRFPNEFIRDRRLSWEARAVAAWMASHKVGFRFDVAYIVRCGPAGRDRVRRMMRELEDAGYLVRDRERNNDGSFGRIVHKLHPRPVAQNCTSDPAPENPSVDDRPETRRSDPAPENPAPGQPSPGEPSPGNTEVYKKTNSKKTKREKTTTPNQREHVQSGGAPGTEEEAEVSAFWDELPGSYRPGPKVRADLQAEVIRLLATRTPAALAAELLDERPATGVRTPVRWLATVLPNLPEEPPQREERAAEGDGRPAWCGKCDEHTRQRENDEGMPYRCPSCHPLVVSV